MKLFRISLAWQMVLATFLGILAGIVFGNYCNVFAPWTSAYIMILKITTIPYLFCAIIHGIGQLHTPQAMQILKRGLLFIGIAWAINILMIYGAVFLFPHPGGFFLSHYTSPTATNLNFAELLIPENIFYSLSNNIIPSVVVFSLLIGISLMHIKEKAPFMHILESLVDSLTKITSWISRITPFGTFLIIAYQVGTIQLTTVKQVSTYIIVYVLIVCLVIFWIFPRLLSSLTNISASRWIKDLSPILILGYSTTVVIVCLPFIIELVRRELQRFLPSDEKTQSQIQGIVSVTFNLPLGTLFLTIFIFFASLFYGNFLNLTAQLQVFINAFLVSLGSVGVGSLINSLGFILETTGLPQEAVTMFLTTLPFTAGFQAMVSVMEISTLSLLITLCCHRLMTLKFTKVLRKSLFTIGPIILLLIAIKSHNPLPTIENCTPSIYDVDVAASKIVEPVSSSSSKEDPLLHILQTKTLRVGFNPNTSPFCFKNRSEQLSGYDMAFARQLGQDLGCEVVFVPMNYDTIAEQLRRGEFDIAMSAVSMNEERLQKMYFTRPYLESKIVYVVKEKDRKQFAKQNVLENDPSLKIAVFKGSIFECYAKSLYADHQILSIESYDKFPETDAHVLLWSEIEAIAWLTRHGNYTLVVPNPALGADLFGYAIAQGSNVFLNYLNAWLTLKKKEGFLEEQYSIWILGNTQIMKTEEKRWSLLHSLIRCE